MKVLVFAAAMLLVTSFAQAGMSCDPEVQVLNLQVEIVRVDSAEENSCTFKFSRPSDRTVNFMANPNYMCPFSLDKLFNEEFEADLELCPDGGYDFYFSGVVVGNDGIDWIKEFDGEFTKIKD